MDALRSILSTGELADRLHVPLRQVESAAGKLGVVAALRINGIPYLNETDSLRIEALLGETTVEDVAADRLTAARAALDPLASLAITGALGSGSAIR